MSKTKTLVSGWVLLSLYAREVRRPLKEAMKAARGPVAEGPTDVRRGARLTGGMFRKRKLRAPDW